MLEDIHIYCSCEAGERVNLSDHQPEQQQIPIMLIVDAVALACRLTSSGSDFSTLNSEIEKWVQTAKRGNVDLTFAFHSFLGVTQEGPEDGGASEAASQNLEAPRVCRFEVCQHVTKLPYLMRDQITITLRRLGIKMVTMEPWEDLASLLLDGRDSFAVVSSDYSLYFKAGSRFIPLDRIYANGNDLIAYVYTPERLARSLSIPISKLPELAIFCSSTYAQTVLVDLFEDIGCIERPSSDVIRIAADFLRSLEPADSPLGQHPVVSNVLKANSQFRRSYNSFLLEFDPKVRWPVVASERHDGSALCRLILGGVRDCALPQWSALVQRTATFRNNCTWPAVGAPYLEAADLFVRPLRQLMYALVAEPANESDTAVIITEHHPDGPVAVPAVPFADVQWRLAVAAGTGCRDLPALLEKDCPARARALHLLLYALTDDSEENSRSTLDDLDSDPLVKLCVYDCTCNFGEPDSHAATASGPHWGLPLLLHLLLSLEQHRARAAAVGPTDITPDAIFGTPAAAVGPPAAAAAARDPAGRPLCDSDLEALVTTVYILQLGIDTAGLPTEAAPAPQANVPSDSGGDVNRAGFEGGNQGDDQRICRSADSALAVAAVVSAAQALRDLLALLRLPGLQPEPRRFFSESVFLLLRDGGAPAQELVRRCGEPRPLQEVRSALRIVLGRSRPEPSPQIEVSPSDLLCPASPLSVSESSVNGNRHSSLHARQSGQSKCDSESYSAAEPCPVKEGPLGVSHATATTGQGSGHRVVARGVAARQGEALPIAEHRDRILEAIRTQPVTCICGETGCGKSSVLPQYIVEDALARGRRVKVVVTQPRRLAAVSLARRVAAQRGEDLGERVGYRVGGGDHVDGRDTFITFVTVGYLLQALCHNLALVRRYTHLILDEVHERSMDSDLMLLLLRRLLDIGSASEERSGSSDGCGFGTCGGKGPCGGLRVVIMSATLQSGLFSEYFTPAGRLAPAPLSVGARRFPVESVFLEDLSRYPALKCVSSYLANCLKRFSNAPKAASRVANGSSGAVGASGRSASGPCGCEADAAETVVKPDVGPDMNKVIVELVHMVAAPGECVLVFLPGSGEITAVQDCLEGSRSGVPMQIFVLHSLVSGEEQLQATAPAARGHCKVVLSTNIAESSITIPDVRFVLDAGLRRDITYDDRRRLRMLLCRWCSRASARQRAGRAGRVAPGTVFHLYTRDFHHHCVPEFDEAEMSRLPVEGALLSVKLLMSQLGRPSELLSQSLSPPPPGRVAAAVRLLYEAGALTRDDEMAPVTLLGRLAVRMPVELLLVKLMLLGVAAGCADSAVVMAAALSLQDPFAMPTSSFAREARGHANELRENATARLRFDAGALSEPLGYLHMYVAWLASDKSTGWARRNGLSHTRMRQLDMLVSDLTDKMARALEHSRALSDINALLALERLHIASRNIAGKTPRGGRDLAAATLQNVCQSDDDTLRFVIAAAFAPTFLYGQPRAEHRGSFILECEINQKGLDPARHVVLTKLHPDTCDGPSLREALRAAGFRVKSLSEYILQRNQGFLVEFEPDRVPEPSPARSAPGRARGSGPGAAHGAGSGVNGACTSAVAKLGAAAGNVDSAAQTAQLTRPGEGDLCFEVKVLWMLLSSLRRQLVLTNPNHRPGSDKPDKITVGEVIVPYQITWTLGLSDTKVLGNWRGATGCLADPKLDSERTLRLGVALSLMGTDSEKVVRAQGLTVLPAGRFGPLMQLLLARADDPDGVEVLVSGSAGQRIHGCKVGSTVWEFRPRALTLRDWARVNRVRYLLSVAIAGDELARMGFEGCGNGIRLQGVKRAEVGSAAEMEGGKLHEVIAALLRGGEKGGNGSSGTNDEVDGSSCKEDGCGARQQWVKCVVEESDSYLPQLTIPTSQYADRIWLLCRNRGDVVVRMSGGWWMVAEWEHWPGGMASQAMSEVKLPSDLRVFEDQAYVLLTWFARGTSTNSDVVLEMVPQLRPEQRHVIQALCERRGLVHRTMGTGEACRLVVGRTLAALKDSKSDSADEPAGANQANAAAAKQAAKAIRVSQAAAGSAVKPTCDPPLPRPDPRPAAAAAQAGGAEAAAEKGWWPRQLYAGMSTLWAKMQSR